MMNYLMFCLAWSFGWVVSSYLFDDELDLGVLLQVLGAVGLYAWLWT
jgi:hypothetical protein